jgi:hypothetical protein
MRRLRARLGARVGACLGALATLASVTLARAQDLSDAPPARDDAASGVVQNRPYWKGSGKERGFMAASFGLGIVFFRPKVQFGYGHPHHSWFGFEGGGGIGISGGRHYAGLRAQYPFIDVRAGVRYEYSAEQRFLVPLDSYTREDTESAKLGRSRYVVGEAEIVGTSPFPGGSLVGLLGGYYVATAPEGAYVFEESLKTIIEPPWVWRARLGYLLHIGWLGSMKIGPAAEVIHAPVRETITLRVGPAVSVGLTHHLEVAGSLMIVAASADELGLIGADLGQLSLTYKWASGDRWSDFP